MKKRWKAAVAAICMGAVVLSFTGCAGKSTELGTPAQATAFSYTEYSDSGYESIKNKANQFAYALSASAYANRLEGNSEGNFSVAPISVFSALSLAAECAAGQTRDEVLSALGVTYGELSSNYSKLYRSLESESYALGGRLMSAFDLSNSIWLNDGLQYNPTCIRNLSQNYFSYTYSADFIRDNANANKALRSFVKDKTRNLIDQDFGLSTKTIFALVNVLYLKDVWNTYGDDLGFTEDKYDFKESDGTTKNLNLLRGYYETGRAFKGDGFRAFYAKTYHGYKIKFIVPEEGRTAGEVFTAQNLAAVNAEKDYSAVDDENEIIYNTRCLFPEFETSYECDLAGLLKSGFGVNRLFDRYSCDLSSIITPTEGWQNYCESVIHANKLKVNKKGIEGAAVTVIPAAGDAGPGPYAKVYEDFVVDKAFGFILTDSHDTVIFSGIVDGL